MPEILKRFAMSVLKIVLGILGLALFIGYVVLLFWGFTLIAEGLGSGSSFQLVWGLIIVATLFPLIRYLS